MDATFPLLDGWPSGLRRTPGKRVGSQGSREFESRLIRSPASFVHRENDRNGVTDEATRRSNPVDPNAYAHDGRLIRTAT